MEVFCQKKKKINGGIYCQQHKAKDKWRYIYCQQHKASEINNNEGCICQNNNNNNNEGCIFIREKNEGCILGNCRFELNYNKRVKMDFR